MKRYILLATLLSASFNNQAIVMRHDTKAQQYEVKAAQYESVIHLDFLTGTLIHPQWILTAAHGTPYMPAKQKLTIGGKQFEVQLIIDDFHGRRYLSKNNTAKVAQLKARIKTRGRTLLKHIEPVWPKRALENNIQGSVSMSFTINTDGTVGAIKIVEATPAEIFNSAAITALSQWQYAKLNAPLTGILTKFDFKL